MSKFTPQQFMEELLQQAPQLSSAQYREYRNDLDKKMAQAQRQEKAMRRVVIAAWMVTAICFGAMIFLSRFSSSGTSPTRMSESLQLALAESVLLCPVVALLLLGLYLFKYRRRVVQSRAAGQQAAIRELQRQLNELRAQMIPSEPAKPQPDTK